MASVAYVRSSGRKGNGPGEFAGDMKLLPGPADSLLVFDMVTQRLTLMAENGTAGRSWVAEEGAALEHLAAAWVHRATLVLDGGEREGVRGVIDRLPEPDAIMIARLDGAGDVWLRRVHDPEGSWDVVRLDGTRLGTVLLPDSLEVLQVGTDFVLGRERDSLDVERIVRYGLRRSDAVLPPLDTVPRGRQPSTPTGDIHEVLGTLIGAQEMYYANNGSYAAVADSLPWRGAGELILLRGDRRGWLGMLVMDGGLACAVGIGYPTPALWPEGTPVCGG